MRYSAYEVYKDSGDEWLPELPEHWSVQRNKAMFSLVKNTVGDRSSEYQLLSLTLNGIIPRDIESGKGKMPAEFDTYQEVKPDDLVFCLFDIDETPRTVGISELDGMITGAYTVFRCLPNAFPQYICYYYLHLDSFKGLRPFYTGLRKVVRSNTFLSIKIPAPPLEEQKQIATFLDRETAKIDTLIAKQEELIRLLQEKRQAVISHAVTKGLNPHAPLKDSGIEWLGQIPAHWTALTFRRVCSLQQGLQIAQSERFSEPAPNRLEYITIRSIHAGDTLENREYIENPPSRAVCYSDDVLMARTGATGEVITNQHGAFHNNFFKINYMRQKVKRDYLVYYLSNTQIKNYLILMAGTTTIPDLNHGAFFDTPFCYPDLPEQEQIVEYLNLKTAKIDKLILKANRAVDLLKERRTALISAAVTGKIDVRHAA